MSQLPFQHLNSLRLPSIQPASIHTLHCKRLISGIMSPPKSDVDTKTLSTPFCYYCKQSLCVCDGTPFKKTTRGSETQQDKQGVTDALSPCKNSAMQSEDDTPHSQRNFTLGVCPLCKMHPCMCRPFRPTSGGPDPTDGGDRLCVICCVYGCPRHPKSN